MGRRGAFRPRVSEPMEVRLLLSGATEALPVLIDGGAPAPAANVPADAYQFVRTAYNGFIQDYFRSVDSVLLARGSNGAINPAANRALFDAEISSALDALAANLSAGAGTDTPAVVAEASLTINGDGVESLRSRLEALPTPTGDQDATPRMFIHESLRTIATGLARTTAQIVDATRA